MRINPLEKNPITLPSGEKWPHTVFLKAVIEHENIEVGDFSYYNDFTTPVPVDYARTLAPYLHPGCPEKLIIGKFVQIAHGAKFITSSANHQMDGVSTFPFAIFGGEWANYQPNFPNKGDTVIGSDVWLGHDCLIMPGVTIGEGCIVASRAVVIKNVPPYTIVAGNPATEIKCRFSQDVVERLLAIAWWDWPQEKITANIEHIVSADVTKLEAIANTC